MDDCSIETNTTPHKVSLDALFAGATESWRSMRYLIQEDYVKRSIRRFALFAVCILAITGSVVGAPSKFVRQATPVPGEYIVVLAASIPDTAVPGVVEALARGYNVEVVRIWSDVLKAGASGIRVD